MVVTKILETTLAAGVTSVQFTDSDIPNSLIRVFCSDADLIYTSLSLTGNTLTVTYPAQSVNKYIALELVKAGLDIVDNLLSDDATKALSAKQGKALDDKIDALDLENLYNVSITLPSDGDMIVYDNGEWINVASKNNIIDLDDVEIDTLTDGQVLAWDTVEEKFINVNQSGGGGGSEYSTDEITIGHWTDGKILYRKVITGLNISLNGANWVSYNTSLPDIDKLINLKAYYTPTNLFLTCAIAEYQYASGYGIQMNTYSSTFNRSINILVIDYTKN